MSSPVTTASNHEREQLCAQDATGQGSVPVPFRNSPELYVTNFHKRFTGVSATANGVVAQQLKLRSLELVGDPLPLAPAPISWWQAVRRSWRKPENLPFTIWHVRRNAEMLAGLIARDILRCPIRLVFTSAAKRRHSWFPRMLISRMDAVIATTATAAQLVPHVAAVVPHGVDIERFVPPGDREKVWAASGFPGRHGIGIVGRVRAEKGTDLFVEAMLRVLPQRPDFTAIVIGQALGADVAFEQELKAKLKAANLIDRCVFVGEVPATRMPEMMQCLSLLVAPPRYEGFGLTPLEAMASGAAVVASDTGAFADMISEGQTGHVVPVGDIESLVNAVLAITSDPKRLASMGQVARQRVAENFALSQEAARIDEVYERLWSGERF